MIIFNPTNLLMKLSIVIALLGLLHSACMAQYYPAPAPIDPRHETELLLQLKSAKPDEKSVHLQLQLTNLYFNKPFKKKADLDKALQYARDAAARSKSLHDSVGFTDAQLFIADILVEQNDLLAAENILPLVNDTAKIDLLLTVSYKFRVRDGDKKTEDLDTAIALAQQARSLAIRLHQPEKEILALQNIAAVHANQKKPDAEQELLNVLAKYRSIGFRNLHYVYYQLAQYEYTAGNYDKAIYYSLETIKSMRSTGDSLAAGDFYVWHSHICREINEFQQSIDYSRMAIVSYTVHSGECGMSWAAFLLTAALRKMKKYQEALGSLQHILKQYPPENVSEDITYNMTIGNIYADMKQYGNAERHLLRAYELNKHQNAIQGMERDLGHLYIEAHQYEKARPFLDRALKIPLEFTSLTFRSYTHYLLYLVDSASGHYLAAMEHLHRNHTLTDSGLAESKQRDIQKLLIQFETREKEDKIRLKDKDIALLNQKALLQKVELGRINLIKNITIGGALLLSVIAFLLYTAYRTKQQNNRVISQKNETLQKLLTEKEWLLKEVHHRVKNNLHTVICLLESQAYYLENDALKAIENSQHRIYAMSLIHQKIYQSEDIKTIDMANYLPEFIRYLRDSFGCQGHIEFHLEIVALKLGVSQAIPLALIVNEALTNSMKYAFPENKPGLISIQLHRIGEKIKLTVADNGIGMDPSLGNTELNSLGIELMKGLSREIKGEITFETGKGTRITVLFDRDRLNDSPGLFIPSTEREATT
jgi:two-component sensor histidine kinase